MKRLALHWIGFCLFAAIGILRANAADSATPFEVAGLHFTAPEGWTRVDVRSPMRKAQFRVDGDAGAAEVVFFHFGKGQGGTVDANIERWFGQFAEPREDIHARTEKETVDEHEIRYVFANGTFMSGPPFGEKKPLKDQALLGAIIKNDEGDVFIKMTGPKATVDKAQPDFKKLVESIGK